MNTTIISRRSFLTAVVALGTSALLGSCSRASTDQLVFSTYKAGTGTYNDLASFANIFTTHHGTQVRLMTSDTSIGRIAPLINGTAQLSRAADETHYAFEGDDEYASAAWGPQAIRQIWTPPGNYGVLTLKDSGIETAADLKGRRIPRILAAVSTNRKIEALLNFGGLTLDDVTFVDIAYSEQAAAIKAGHIDVMYQNVVGAPISELASTHPIRWINVGGGSKEQYSTWESLAPMMRPGPTHDAAGLAEGEEAWTFQYSIVLATLATFPEDRVYTMLKTLHDNFDSFVGTTPDAQRFALDNILLTPLVIPFHPGTVRFLKEHGRWNDSLQARNDALLDREKLMHAAWPDFLEEHKHIKNPAAEWKKYKKDNLPRLPEVVEP